VTPNLKHALERLQPQKGEPEIVLWIDAICINQEDVSERNVQTANMRAIYQQAASVTVWLGKEYAGSKGAIQLARDLHACSSGEDVRKMILERKESLDALVTLFRRQYWWRIWVIQEVSCARRAVVYCGDDWIPWSTLDGVCDILRTVKETLRSLFYKYPSWIRTLTYGGPRGLQLSRYSPTIAAPPLLELLLTHKSKKSTDPKDKVYALVGISSSRHSFGVIDYSLSVQEIYTHTSRHIITTSQKLDIICVKNHFLNDYGLPSWVPDWTRPPQNSGSTIMGLHHHEPAFTAAGDTIADIEFLHNGSVLKTKGIIIDTITTLGMPYKKSGAPSNVVPALEAFHDWWSIFISAHSTSLSSQIRFSRAITCGTWNFSSEEAYAAKLEAIFALSDGLLSESEFLRSGPPSRSSTMGSSVFSLTEEEMDVEGQGEGEEEEKVQFQAILEAGQTMNKRRLFLSEGGLVGLAPRNAEEGDIVCVLLGCRFPVVLRRGVLTTLVGEAYVDEYMNGEAIAGLKEGRFALESFEIH